jgi:hypothetical protein
MKSIGQSRVKWLAKSMAEELRQQLNKVADREDSYAKQCT